MKHDTDLNDFSKLHHLASSISPSMNFAIKNRKFGRGFSCRALISVVILAGLVVAPCLGATESAQRPPIVKDGKPNSQIVIAENPPRMVDVAARELQTYVKKISGAELPIVTSPSPDLPVTIFVGRSKFTDEQGIKNEGLNHGAYRIVSGPDWLVLLGSDYDFVPPEPSATKRGDAERDRVHQEWDKITGTTWENPMLALHRKFNAETGLWLQDEGGSFNAVNGFLYDLGVRWYMPGELGEVIPQMASIQLPEIDRTVHPDYPLRFWHGAYQSFHPDTVFWDRRIGINSGDEVLGSSQHVHGLKNVYSRPEMQEKHPEFYAMIGGQLDYHHANFLSEPLMQETAKYARTVFDHYNTPAVSIWPADGLRPCETAPAMPQADYVGQFMERVGREVLKTHPDRTITYGAYSGYQQPPGNVEQFPPNIMVFLAAHRPGLDDEQRWKERMELVEGWKKKTPTQPIIRNSNSYYEFVIHPRSFARELQALKGISLGDWNEVRRRPGGNKQVVWTTPGLDHLNSYINARFLWDADQDIEAVLDEYHTLFYGPARDKMKEAFDFAEANYTRVDRSITPTEARVTFVEKLQEAKKSVEGTIYGERIDLILSEIKPLDELRKDLAEEIAAKDRKDVPLVIAAKGADAEAKTYHLRDIVTGDKPDVETTFQVRWEDNALVFNITCNEPDMKNRFVTKDVMTGDNVAMLIESQPGTGDYYAIEINPDGDIADCYRRQDRKSVEPRWSSRANVKVDDGADVWKMEVRFPIMAPEEGALDPYHNIVGTMPTAENPWFIQVGRVRHQDGVRKPYTFNPTGGGYHVLNKFARLQVEE